MFGGINAALKLADILDKLMNDAGLREKFEREGRIAGRLAIEEYDIFFEVRRRE